MAGSIPADVDSVRGNNLDNRGEAGPREGIGRCFGVLNLGRKDVFYTSHFRHQESPMPGLQVKVSGNIPSPVILTPNA